MKYHFPVRPCFCLAFISCWICTFNNIVGERALVPFYFVFFPLFLVDFFLSLLLFAVLSRLLFVLCENHTAYTRKQRNHAYIDALTQCFNVLLPVTIVLLPMYTSYCRCDWWFGRCRWRWECEWVCVYIVRMCSMMVPVLNTIYCSISADLYT